MCNMEDYGYHLGITIASSVIFVLALFILYLECSKLKKVYRYSIYLVILCALCGAAYGLFKMNLSEVCSRAPADEAVLSALPPEIKEYLFKNITSVHGDIITNGEVSRTIERFSRNQASRDALAKQIDALKE